MHSCDAEIYLIVHFQQEYEEGEESSRDTGGQCRRKKSSTKKPAKTKATKTSAQRAMEQDLGLNLSSSSSSSSSDDGDDVVEQEKGTGKPKR